MSECVCVCGGGHTYNVQYVHYIQEDLCTGPYGMHKMTLFRFWFGRVEDGGSVSSILMCSTLGGVGGIFPLALWKNPAIYLLYPQEGGKDSPCCSELDYSFKRLVKGLASSRKGARQGFTTVLTELLSQFDCLSPETVISMLSETLAISGTVKSQVGRVDNITYNITNVI